ncbi:hypothetical protein ES703_103813 [subsurface metagenome]
MGQGIVPFPGWKGIFSYLKIIWGEWGKRSIWTGNLEKEEAIMILVIQIDGGGIVL